jgi:exopolyphosphatase/guanosine-5'-triphosphate,3'-diphosphate pyrophosphatase
MVTARKVRTPDPDPRASSAAADVRPAELAAVDLGSNSFHLMVARASGEGDLQVLDRLREPVRLAAGLDADRRLSAEVQDLALACLRRFGQRIKHLPADRVRVVGTNTLREMRRGDAFVLEASAALGHDIEIISGIEEARLVYEGVTRGLGQEQPRRLVIDIGGGSTELVIGNPDGPQLMESVALGCVVHTQRFFEDGEITRKRFQAARLAARVEIEYLERTYRKYGWDTAIGSSGTVRGIWRVMMERGWTDDALTRDGLEKVVELLITTGNIALIDYPSLRDDRRPVFAGGLAVLAGIFDGLGIERMRTSERALREGLIYDLIGRLGGGDVRGESVANTAQRFAVDIAHARDVETTARVVLAQVADAWKLPMPGSAELLAWAAQLHEIGLAVAHASYHKHGEYILRNGDFQGFSQTEQKLVAVLVRLHRGKFASSVFDDVPRVWVEPLKRLAILLRLAYLLNRSRTPDMAPKLKLTAGRRQLEVRFPRRWLDAHPLTREDLDREAAQLRAAGFKLIYG